MPVLFNDNIQINAPKAVDNKYMKFASGAAAPYDSVAEVNSLIPLFYRHKGLTVLVHVSGINKEYWYRAGTADVDLVEKTATGVGGGASGFIDRFYVGDPGKPAGGATTFTYASLIGKSIDDIRIHVEGTLMAVLASDRRAISAFNTVTGQVTLNQPLNLGDYVQIYA